MRHFPSNFHLDLKTKLFSSLLACTVYLNTCDCHSVHVWDIYWYNNRLLRQAISWMTTGRRRAENRDIWHTCQTSLADDADSLMLHFGSSFFTCNHTLPFNLQDERIKCTQLLLVCLSPAISLSNITAKNHTVINYHFCLQWHFALLSYLAQYSRNMGSFPIIDCTSCSILLSAITLIISK